VNDPLYIGLAILLYKKLPKDIEKKTPKIIIKNFFLLPIVFTSSSNFIRESDSKIELSISWFLFNESSCKFYNKPYFLP